jgi:hypothetical protein
LPSMSCELHKKHSKPIAWPGTNSKHFQKQHILTAIWLVSWFYAEIGYHLYWFFNLAVLMPELANELFIKNRREKLFWTRCNELPGEWWIGQILHVFAKSLLVTASQQV